MKHLDRYRATLGNALWIAGLAALFVLLGADPAFATPAGTAMPWDTPLTNLLNNLQGTVARIAITVAIVVTGLAFFYRRFWCRNLCPAGAFLSLINGLRLLARWTPAPRPAQCDLGVRSGEELDCIRCDRCRHAAQ